MHDAGARRMLAACLTLFHDGMLHERSASRRVNWLISRNPPFIPSNDSGSVSLGACTVTLAWTRSMLTSVASSPPCDNRLLALRSAQDDHALAPYFEEVILKIKETTVAIFT